MEKQLNRTDEWASGGYFKIFIYAIEARAKNPRDLPFRMEQKEGIFARSLVGTKGIEATAFIRLCRVCRMQMKQQYQWANGHASIKIMRKHRISTNKRIGTQDYRWIILFSFGKWHNYINLIKNHIDLMFCSTNPHHSNHVLINEVLIWEEIWKLLQGWQPTVFPSSVCDSFGMIDTIVIVIFWDEGSLSRHLQPL